MMSPDGAWKVVAQRCAAAPFSNMPRRFSCCHARLLHATTLETQRVSTGHPSYHQFVAVPPPPVVMQNIFSLAHAFFSAPCCLCCRARYFAATPAIATRLRGAKAQSLLPSLIWILRRLSSPAPQRCLFFIPPADASRVAHHYTTATDTARYAMRARC